MKKPLRPNRKLLAFWRGLSPAEKRAFAGDVKSSVDSLRQYVDGRRTVHPEMAVKLERASWRIMPVGVDRADLSPVCAKCKYVAAVRQISVKDLR